MGGLLCVPYMGSGSAASVLALEWCPLQELAAYWLSVETEGGRRASAKKTGVCLCLTRNDRLSCLFIWGREKEN